ISKRRISGMALLILALLQRIFLMSSLMLLLVWLIFFMVLDRKSGSAGMPRPISYAVFCLKKKNKLLVAGRLRRGSWVNASNSPGGRQQRERSAHVLRYGSRSVEGCQ